MHFVQRANSMEIPDASNQRYLHDVLTEPSLMNCDAHDTQPGRLGEA